MAGPLDPRASDPRLPQALCAIAMGLFLPKLHTEHLLGASHYTTAGNIMTSKNLYLHLAHGLVRKIDINQH